MASAPESLEEPRQTASLPVVFMTAKVQASELVYYNQIGALDVIIKPFDPMRLANEVLHIWKNHYKNESYNESYNIGKYKNYCG